MFNFQNMCGGQGIREGRGQIILFLLAENKEKFLHINSKCKTFIYFLNVLNFQMNATRLSNKKWIDMCTAQLKRCKMFSPAHVSVLGSTLNETRNPADLIEAADPGLFLTTMAPCVLTMRHPKNTTFLFSRRLRRVQTNNPTLRL